jgi:hypothetical protein
MCGLAPPDLSLRAINGAASVRIMSNPVPHRIFEILGARNSASFVRHGDLRFPLHKLFVCLLTINWFWLLVLGLTHSARIPPETKAGISKIY